MHEGGGGGLSGNYRSFASCAFGWRANVGAKGWLEARMIETYYTVTILNPVHKQPAKKRAKAQFPLVSLPFL